MLKFIKRIINRKQKRKQVSTINKDGKVLEGLEKTKQDYIDLDQETINNAFLFYCFFSIQLPDIEQTNRVLRDLIRAVKKGRYLNDGSIYTFETTTFTNKSFFHTEEGRISIRVKSVSELRTKLIELLTAIEEVKFSDVNSPTRQYYERILTNFIRQFDVLVRVIQYGG